MDLTSRISRAVALTLLPLLLIANVLCVCGSAAAAETSAGSSHSCCATEGSHEESPADHEHRADCNHCVQSKFTPHEAASIPAPQVAYNPWILASIPYVEIPCSTCTDSARAHRDASVAYSIPPLFSLKCSLLI